MILAGVPDLMTPLWLQWNFDPFLVLGIALLTAAYFYALGPLRRRYGWAETVDRGQVAWFVSGTLLLFIALCSPLDTLGDDYLFSAHMIQHMLLALVVPPLWLLGTPDWMLAPLFRLASVVRVAKGLTNPVVAFGLFNADMWLWHAPALYDATLANDQIHILEHLTFIVFGVLFWWPILSPVRALPRISKGFGILYSFLACQPMVALGALITFAANPLYAPYVTAPRILGSTPLGDQQLGGLIMWLPTNIPYVIALSALFFQWVGDQDHAERAAAGEFEDFPDEESAGESTSTQTAAISAATAPGTPE
ncbi:MAG: cytochrome c oxidase assembly protein [Ktedonobacterales bacterium]